MSSGSTLSTATAPAATKRCLNCGTPLGGPYCSECGQHDVDYHRSFHHLAHDLLENLFHFEGKFFVTVAWLLAKPGRITCEFNSGRRASQVNPLRLYLFVSVLFFLVMSLLRHGHLLELDRPSVDSVHELARELRAAPAAKASPSAMPPAEGGRTTPPTTTAAEKAPDADGAGAEQAAEPGASRPPGRVAVLSLSDPDALSGTLVDKLASGELTLDEIRDALEHRAPTLLFLGVPLFALLLKLSYLPAHRYYIEHLIFSLHLHTWMFLMLLLRDGYLRLAAFGPGWFVALGSWAVAGWMLWYTLASFRSVYQQGWTRTAIKVSLLSLGYLLLLGALTMVVALLTLGWLALG